MAEIGITPTAIENSIAKFILDSDVGSTAVFIPPYKFDPNSSATTAWWQLSVPQYKQVVGRQGVGTEFVGSIRCEVFGRAQDKQTAHTALASQIQDVLCQGSFPVKDFAATGDPIIGLCSVYEPEIQNRGAKGAYQMSVLTAKFKVTRTV